MGPPAPGESNDAPGRAGIVARQLGHVLWPARHLSRQQRWKAWLQLVLTRLSTSERGSWQIEQGPSSGGGTSVAVADAGPTCVPPSSGAAASRGAAVSAEPEGALGPGGMTPAAAPAAGGPAFAEVEPWAGPPDARATTSMSRSRWAGSMTPFGSVVTGSVAEPPPMAAAATAGKAAGEGCPGE